VAQFSLSYSRYTRPEIKTHIAHCFLSSKAHFDHLDEIEASLTQLEAILPLA
jgi:hypothetical protein